MNSSRANVTFLISNSNMGSNITVHWPSTQTVTIWYVVTCAISLAGFLPMALLIVTVLLDPQLRAGPGILILNSLCVELLMSCIDYPILNYVTYRAYFKDPFELDCRTLFSMQALFNPVAYWSSALLAFNRLIAVVFPTHYDKFSTLPVVVLQVAVTWIIATSVFVTGVTGLNAIAGRLTNGECGILKYVRPNMVTFGFVYGYVVPVMFPAFAYGAVFVKLACFAPIRVNSANPTPTETRRQRRRIHMTQMLCSSYVLSLVTFIPSPVVYSLFSNVVIQERLLALLLRTVMLLGQSCDPVCRLKATFAFH